MEVEAEGSEQQAEGPPPPTPPHDAEDAPAPQKSGAAALHSTKDWYKRSGQECRHPSGCRNWIVRGGLCIKHGAQRTVQRRICSTPDCTSIAKKEGKCCKCGGFNIRKTCRVDGCNNWVINKGVCVKHGAKRSERRICSVEGCTSVAKRGGVCFRHQPAASKLPGCICTFEGCPNVVIRNGLCGKHAGIKRAPAKICKVEGCGNRVQNNSLCRRHGCEVKMCSVEGCPSQVRKGGLCFKHGKRKAAESAAGDEGAAPKRKRQKKESAANDLAPVAVPQLPPTGKNAPRKKYSGSRQCSVEGCTSASRAGGGVCIKHGAKRYFYPCSHEGCTNRSVRNKLCKKHGAAAKLCSHPEGCQKLAHSGGLCYTHTPAKPKSCSHIGCNNQSRVGGLCDQHKSGAISKMKCLVEDCSKNATSEGLCVMHLANQNASSDVQAAFLCRETNEIDI